MIRERLSWWFIGVGFFSLPWIRFLSDGNLRILSNDQILNIGLIVVSAAVITAAIVIALGRIMPRRVRLNPEHLFLIVGLLFYSQFFYRDSFRLFLENDYSVFFARLFFLAILLFISLVFILAIRRVPDISRRFLSVFASVAFIVYLVPSFNYARVTFGEPGLDQQFGEKESNVGSRKTNILNMVNNRIKNENDQISRNIYFVVPDAMNSLEVMADQRVLNVREQIDELSNMGAKYVSNTYSAYNKTVLTLQAIFSLGYPLDEESPRYSDEGGFFPHTMREGNLESPQLLLLNILDALGIRLIWQGNQYASCIGSTQWECAPEELNVTYGFMENPFIGGLVLDGLVFFDTSIIGGFLRSSGLDKFGGYVANQNNNIGSFSSFIPTLSESGFPFFAFIHHLAPHDPHNRTRDCKEVGDGFFSDGRFGYFENYMCTLTQIKKFLTAVARYDPAAIVVIQADHGWPVSLNTSRSSTVFNVVRAPQDCLKKFSLPQSTVNSIRFSLNCAYGLDLPFEQVKHYSTYSEDELYGRVKLVYKKNNSEN
jgi:hypothetical protein